MSEYDFNTERSNFYLYDEKTLKQKRCMSFGR